MGISLIIKRDDGTTRTDIALAEWENIVATDGDLRMTSQPIQARDPRTGELIRIARAQGASEIYLEERWIPFLAWGRGVLTCRYLEEMELPGNPLRIKIVDLSRKLHAAIYLDVQDEPLEW
jgi:hypothetical protein